MYLPEIQDQVKSAVGKAELVSPLLSEYFEHSFKRLDAKLKSQDTETNESRQSAEGSARTGSARDSRSGEQQLMENSSSRQSSTETRRLNQSREQQDGQNEKSTEKSNGGGKLSALIKEAVLAAVQARPLHIYPEAKPSEKTPSTKPSDKNPISGFDLPEIAPGIKLGMPFEY